MKSCICQLSFGTKMLWEVISRKALGLLSSKRSKPGPQPDTASCTCDPFLNQLSKSGSMKITFSESG